MTTPLSKCCKAPVSLKFSRETDSTFEMCESCGKPCEVEEGKTNYPKNSDSSPINASAVEELRDEMEELFEGIWDISSKKSAYEFRDKLITRLLTHVSTLSDSTLREVLGEVEKQKVEIIPDNYVRRPLGEKLRMAKLEGINIGISVAVSIITKRLEK